MGDGASTIAEASVRILLADDNEGIRSALRLVLHELNGQEPAADESAPLDCTVVEAHDADGALEQLGQHPVDVVLLDWELPGLPPDQLLRKIKCSCPGSVVIAMSGRLEAREQAALLGVDGFVSKSEPPDRLLALLRMAQAQVGRCHDRHQATQVSARTRHRESGTADDAGQGRSIGKRGAGDA